MYSIKLGERREMPPMVSDIHCEAFALFWSGWAVIRLSKKKMIINEV